MSKDTTVKVTKEIKNTFYMSGNMQFCFSRPTHKGEVEPMGTWFGCRGFFNEALVTNARGNTYPCRDHPNEVIDLKVLDKCKYLPLLVRPATPSEEGKFLAFMEDLATFEKDHRWLPNRVMKTNLNRVYFVKMSKTYISAYIWTSMIQLLMRSLCAYSYAKGEMASYVSKVLSGYGVDIKLLNFIYDNISILNKTIDPDQYKTIPTQSAHGNAFGEILYSYKKSIASKYKGSIYLRNKEILSGYDTAFARTFRPVVSALIANTAKS